jgi:hypothetical protein
MEKTKKDFDDSRNGSGGKTGNSKDFTNKNSKGRGWLWTGWGTRKMSLEPRISVSLPEKEGSGEGIGREEIWLGY